MSLFKIAADSPVYDQVYTLDGLLYVAATYTDDDAGRQPLAKEFVFSVNDSAKATVECQRYDGKMAFLTVSFDGEQLKIESQGIR